MKSKPSKEDLIEILRLWDVPQLNAALDFGILAEEVVNMHKSDLLLECIHRKSEPLFLKVLNKPFNFNKNKFLYLHHAVRSVQNATEAIFIEKLLENMDEKNICKKDPHSKKTALHIACESNLQSYALLLSRKGLSWSDLTINKQTPLHLLLRSSSYIELELITELSKANINRKDDMNVSCKDIIKSFSFDSEWSAIKENQVLLEKLKI